MGLERDWRKLERVIEEIWSYLDNLMIDKQTNALTEQFLKLLM